LISSQALEEVIKNLKISTRENFDQSFQHQQRKINENINKATQDLEKGSKEAKEIYENAQNAQQNAQKLMEDAANYVVFESQKVMEQMDRVRKVHAKLQLQAADQSKKEIELDAESRRLKEKIILMDELQKQLDSREAALGIAAKFQEADKAALVERESQLKRREAELERRFSQLDRLPAYTSDANSLALQAIEKELQQRTDELNARETDIQDRETAVRRREENLRQGGIIPRSFELRPSPSNSPSKASTGYSDLTAISGNIAAPAIHSSSEAASKTTTRSGRQAHYRSTFTSTSSQLPRPINPIQRAQPMPSSRAGKQRLIEDTRPAGIREGRFADIEEPCRSIGIVSSIMTKASSFLPFGGSGPSMTPAAATARQSLGHASDDDEVFGSAQSRVSFTQSAKAAMAASKVPLPTSTQASPAFRPTLSATSSGVPSTAPSEKRDAGKITPIERLESSKKPRTSFAEMAPCVDLAGFFVPAGVPFQCWPVDADQPLALDSVLSAEYRTGLFEEIREHEYLDQEGAGQVLQFIQTNSFVLPKKRQSCMNCRLRLKKSDRSGYCQMNLNDSFTRFACTRCVGAGRPCIVMAEASLILLIQRPSASDTRRITLVTGLASTACH
jgi:hypothetical protein